MLSRGSWNVIFFSLMVWVTGCYESAQAVFDSYASKSPRLAISVSVAKAILSLWLSRVRLFI